MSAGTPYIGSKINLISKAEIRYQGTLYQVDTKEATVTLAKVRSFGTENRPVSKPIPPRNETYEFIIFRGSDIKDLNVIDVPPQPPEPEESPPQDPAILSATHVPPMSMAPPLSQQGAPQRPPPAGYPPFHQPNMYSPFGMPYVRPPVMMGARPGPHPPIHPSQAAPIPREQPQQSILGAPGMAIPPQPHINSHLGPSSENPTSIIGAPPEPTAAPSSESEPQASSTPMVQGTVTEEPMPKPSLPLERESPGVQTRAKPSVPVTTQQVQPPISEQRSNVSLESQPQVDSTTPHEGGAGSMARGQQNRRRYQQRPQENRGGNRGQNRRGGYRGNYRGGRGGGSRPPRGGNHGNNGPVYRYESEFDFESANARFKKEAFEEEFRALNIEDKTESHSRRESESGEVDSMDNRGEEVEVVDEADDSEDDFYDKSKSFFDSISRETGPNRRADRNAERELNTETFGVSNYRVYRPRGRGRGRGYRGRRYRGGDGGYGNRQDNSGSYGNRGRGANKQRDGNRQGRPSSEKKPNTTKQN